MKLWKLFIFVVLLDYGLCRKKVYLTMNTRKLTKSDDITVKLKIHFDSVAYRIIYQKHGFGTNELLKSTAKRIVSEVEAIFENNDLYNRIKFDLIDVKTLRNSSRLVMNENGSKYLRQYCSWQSLKKQAQMYYSVLITGLDLYYRNKRGEKVRRSTARGFMNGMCSLRRSCTLIEWHPKNSAYLLAHEIAHSLGARHDGTNNECSRRGHIMGVSYNRSSHPRTWSSCSKVEIKEFLTSTQSWCLRTYKSNSYFLKENLYSTV